MKHAKQNPADTNKDRETNALDYIEQMWDRDLAEGDDKFYKAVHPKALKEDADKKPRKSKRI